MNAITSPTTLNHASRQWASRPADERFLNLLDLRETVSGSRKASTAKVVSNRQLKIEPVADDGLRGIQIVGQNGTPASMTHWSFGQLASLAGAPASYMRKLPAPIVANCLNYGLQFSREVEEAGVLLTRTEAGVELRAATGPNYGRIWNSDIVDALIEKFGDGRTGDFRVPGEFGKEVEVTKANTTIYGSDRDMFVFLADETNRVEMPNRRDGKSGSLARGFFVWNSEVGSQSIGAAFFLFDYACSNRIVWGAEGFKEIRLRHSSGAPDRWLEDVTPVLLDYANAKAAPIEATIRAAQQRRVDDNLEDFLKNRQFKMPQIEAIKAAHEREENRPIETVWDVVTGVTALAKTIGWQDDRVALERRAGKILDLVAA